VAKSSQEIQDRGYGVLGPGRTVALGRARRERDTGKRSRTMRVIPVDSHRLRVLVVNEPQPQHSKTGEPVRDRDGQVMWQVDVALMLVNDKGEAGRVEAVQMALPETGFPKGLGMG